MAKKKAPAKAKAPTKAKAPAKVKVIKAKAPAKVKAPAKAKAIKSESLELSDVMQPTKGNYRYFKEGKTNVLRDMRTLTQDQYAELVLKYDFLADLTF